MSRPRETAELVHELTAASMSLASPLGWKRALDAAARMPELSAANAMLVARQRPDATMVRSAPDWARQGRHVLAAEVGARVLVAQRSYGSIPREVALASPIPRGANVGLVYDVRQTRSDNIRDHLRPEDIGPELLCQGHPRRLLSAVEAQLMRAGFALVQDNDQPQLSRVDQAAREIVTRQGVAEVVLVETLLRDLSRMHVREAGAPDGAELDVCAESVAYVIGRRAGFDFSLDDTHNLAGWARGDHKVLLDTMHRVVGSAFLIGHRLQPARGASSQPIPNRTRARQVDERLTVPALER